MIRDRFDYPISTTSQTAKDHYINAVDLLLAGQVGISKTFQSAIEADPDFTLGYVGKARGLQFEGDMAAAKTTMDKAREIARPLDAREQSHVNAFGLLIDGKGPLAYAAIRDHVDTYPRDALVAQTCSSVFGLIGFSGKPGREAEILAYTAALLPHYGEDWWCLSQYAFALCENGTQDRASAIIDRSLAMNPLNANGAHVRSHIYYETGATELGISYLEDWLKAYDRAGYLHGHLSWHAALWSLDQGDTDRMWDRIETDIKPGVAQGMPINVLTDTASILYRAELAGVDVPKERWTAISDYASQFFPNASLGFIDIHAALAHAMAGNTDALMRLIKNPNPATGELVTPVAQAYRAIAQGNWANAVSLLVSAMADHARLGGSRAQRDLLEFSLLGALLKLGKDEEAKRLLMLRRPALAGMQSLHGLSAH
jgi:tetratricopeptide (TPR) repeat protein